MKTYQFLCLAQADYLNLSYVNKLNETQRFLVLQTAKDNAN